MKIDIVHNNKGNNYSIDVYYFKESEIITLTLMNIYARGVVSLKFKKINYKFSLHKVNRTSLENYINKEKFINIFDDLLQNKIIDYEINGDIIVNNLLLLQLI